MATNSGSTIGDVPVRTKQPRQQLTQGMEHMRSYVTIETPKPASMGKPSENLDGEDAYGVPATINPIRKATTTDQSSENPQKRSDPFQFGTRYLEEGDDIFAHNAWDHVEVDAQYDDFIQQQIQLQRENAVTDFDKKRFNEKPEKWWDRFYSKNSANFFKDRKWLVQEFPLLGELTRAEYGPCKVLEVGAGAGNTAFPLLAMNQNPKLDLHACDYSAKAIDVIRAQTAYIEQPSPKILQADVWDVTSTELPPGVEQGSLDVVLMIFIFSALSPNQWQKCIDNIWKLLKPGGEVLFRDYGRGDLAQVRFKKGRYLDENFYVRGDGTRVYFFEEEELGKIWSRGSPDCTMPLVELASEECDSGKLSAQASETNKTCNDLSNITPSYFEIINLAVDRRMLVNRQRRLKMYRCWLQGRFRKPLSHKEG